MVRWKDKWEDSTYVLQFALSATTTLGCVEWWDTIVEALPQIKERAFKNTAFRKVLSDSEAGL